MFKLSTSSINKITARVNDQTLDLINDITMCDCTSCQGCNGCTGCATYGLYNDGWHAILIEREKNNVKKAG